MRKEGDIGIDLFSPLAALRVSPGPFSFPFSLVVRLSVHALALIQPGQKVAASLHAPGIMTAGPLSSTRAELPHRRANVQKWRWTRTIHSARI